MFRVRGSLKDLVIGALQIGVQIEFLGATCRCWRRHNAASPQDCSGLACGQSYVGFEFAELCDL